MKKMSVLFLFCFASGILLAQNGVVTLKRKMDVYYGQWYVSKKWENSMLYFDRVQDVEAKILELRNSSYYFLEESEETEKGNLIIKGYNDVGFSVLLLCIKENKHEAMLLIRITDSSPEPVEKGTWYSKLFKGTLISFELDQLNKVERTMKRISKGQSNSIKKYQL
jgi:hypothetical protein